jgi:hypothetical protein
MRMLIADGRKFDDLTVGLARKLEGTQKEFAKFMISLNGGLKINASGQADIFTGGTESREEVAVRILNIKSPYITFCLF